MSVDLDGRRTELLDLRMRELGASIAGEVSSAWTAQRIRAIFNLEKA